MDKDTFYRRVISSCYTKIIEDLDPVPLLDIMIERSYFPLITIRDIKEIPQTTRKNREIMSKVISKGPKAYDVFLQMLRRSGNGFVYDMLKTKGEELEKKEQEKIKTSEQEKVKTSEQEKVSQKQTSIKPPQPMIMQPTPTVARELKSTESLSKDISQMSLSTNVNVDSTDMAAPSKPVMAASVESSASSTPATSKEAPMESGPVWSVREGKTSTQSNQFFKKFTEAKTQSMYEGRILDMDKSWCEDAIKNFAKKIDVGGYGEVFLARSTDKSEMSVVIKRIQCKGDEDHLDKKRSATSEMLAARLLHFAIVPLWAMAEDVNTETYYFIMPYFENNSLALNLHSDREAIESSEKLKLSKFTRLKILYQVACAMAFLHRKIPNFRSSYVHRDITTRNIVLDSVFNARLMDFGLAREYTPGRSGVTLRTSNLRGAPGYFRTNRESRLTVATDVYNFGIVILEVLSSKPACYGEEGEHFLKNKLKDGHFKDDFEDNIEFVWGKKDKYNSAVIDCLVNLATECLKEPKESINSAQIREKLKDQVRNEQWTDPQKDRPEIDRQEKDKQEDGQGKDRQEEDRQEKRCVICLINPVHQDAVSILNHGDACKLYVCVACMRNSYLNPIECHSCGKEVQPTIGHQWAAVLVAGNDVTNTATAETFKNDTLKVRRVITSRHPMTMGISIDNVFISAPQQPGTPQQLIPVVEQCFKLVGKQKIHSLLFYFTGHHGQAKGFKLGTNDEYMTTEKLQGYIDEAVKESGCRRVFVLLDCCAAPELTLKSSCSFYWIKSSSVTQETEFPEGGGSLLTEFLVQGLKGRSSRDKCLNHRNKGRCSVCETFSSKNGFIMIMKLKAFAEKHINEYVRDNRLVTKQSIPSASKEGRWEDAVFAYYINKVVYFEFALQYEKQEEKHIVWQLPETQRELQLELFKSYRDTFLPQRVKPADFADVLAITISTGPRPYNKHELSTLEKIEAAWNGKRKLCVSLRKEENLHNGKVGLFVRDGDASIVMDFLKHEKEICQYSEVDSKDVVTIGLKDEGVRKLWRSVKNNKPDTDKDVRIWTDLVELLNKIKENQKIEQKGHLEFTFPQQSEDGYSVTNFYSVHIVLETSL